MIDFLFGALIGAFGIIVLAMHFSRRAQSKSPPQQQHGVSAIGVSMNGNSAEPMTLHNATAIFRQLDNGSA